MDFFSGRLINYSTNCCSSSKKRLEESHCTECDGYLKKIIFGYFMDLTVNIKNNQQMNYKIICICSPNIFCFKISKLSRLLLIFSKKCFSVFKNFG